MVNNGNDFPCVALSLVLSAWARVYIFLQTLLREGRLQVQGIGLRALVASWAVFIPSNLTNIMYIRHHNRPAGCLVSRRGAAVTVHPVESMTCIATWPPRQNFRNSRILYQRGGCGNNSRVAAHPALAALPALPRNFRTLVPWYLPEHQGYIASTLEGFLRCRHLVWMRPNR